MSISDYPILAALIAVAVVTVAPFASLIAAAVCDGAARIKQFLTTNTLSD